MLKNWWHNHVQKTLGWLSGLIGGGSLLSYLAGYERFVTQLVGVKTFAALMLGIGAVVAIRAHQATAQQNASLPPPVNQPK